MPQLAHPFDQKGPFDTRNGSAVWEVREDKRAGWLRMTASESSKQAILDAGRGCPTRHWMYVLEYARWHRVLRTSAMTPRQAMFALGDAVYLPVVKWLAHNCLVPLLRR